MQRLTLLFVSRIFNMPTLCRWATTGTQTMEDARHAAFDGQ